MATSPTICVDVKILAAYIADFKNENKAKRITAIKNLCNIAKAMGEERVRNELIPFISTGILHIMLYFEKYY